MKTMMWVQRVHVISEILIYLVTNIWESKDIDFFEKSMMKTEKFWT